MNKHIFNIPISALLIAGCFISCKKNNLVIDKVVTPPSYVKFNVRTAADTANAIYYIKSDNTPFKIPIGITTISDKDRTINLCYSSPTAVAGIQYNAPATIVIPAGKALDSLSISGLFAGYPLSSKVDVLTIKICGGDVPANSYWTTYKVTLRKYCDVISTDLIGSFANSTDTYNGGASSKPNYTATVSNWTPISSTSASIVIKNLGATSDNGWGPFSATDPSLNPGLTATIDWSSPSNFSVTIPLQNYFNDGSGMSTINATTGTFSSCDQTYTIVAKVKYAGNGSTYTHTSIFRR